VKNVRLDSSVTIGIGTGFIVRVRERTEWIVEEEIKRLARKYIWWKSADVAIQTPEMVVAQAMNIGDYEDICTLSEVLGEEDLRYVVEHAEAGMFDERSWHFWHYRLGLAEPGKVPRLPMRKIPPEHVGGVVSSQLPVVSDGREMLFLEK
jgi:hypothetical protein